MQEMPRELRPSKRDQILLQRCVRDRGTVRHDVGIDATAGRAKLPEYDDADKPVPSCLICDDHI